MNAPALVVLLTWALALGWFCLVGAWGGALARPTVGSLGAVRVALWLGFASVTAFVLAAGLVWPLRSTAAVVAGAVVTVVAGAAWLLVRRRRGPVAGGHRELTRSWWPIVPIAALVVVAYLAADAVFGPVTNYDTGLYHLNAIVFAQDSPTIHGLANLHTRLGTNVSAFSLAAFGANTGWAGDAFRLVTGLFLLAAFVDLGLRVLDGRAHAWRRPGTYVLALALAAAVPGLLELPGYRIASPSPDTIALLATVVAGAYLVDALATPDRAWTAVAVVASGLAASTRTQLWVAFALTLVVLAGAWWLRRRRAAPAAGPSLLVGAGVVLSVVTGALLAVRDALLSGWLLFPATYFPVPVDWQVPRAAAESTRDWILSWARDPTVGPEQTIGTWYWLGDWARGAITDWWVAAGLCLAALGVVAWGCAAVARRRAPADAGPRPLGGWPVLVLALVPTVAGLIAWFFTAPDPRFAWGSLLLVGAIPAGLAFTRLRLAWPRPELGGPGVAGVVATGLLALVAVPYGVAQARDAQEAVGAATEIRTYDFGPLTVEATVVPVPRPPIVAFTLPDGNDVGLTDGGDQCWEFVPCMPYPNDSLRFRGQTYADGFTTAD